MSNFKEQILAFLEQKCQTLEKLEINLETENKQLKVLIKQFSKFDFLSQILNTIKQIDQVNKPQKEIIKKRQSFVNNQDKLDKSVKSRKSIKEIHQLQTPVKVPNITNQIQNKKKEIPIQKQKIQSSIPIKEPKNQFHSKKKVEKTKTIQSTRIIKKPLENDEKKETIIQDKSEQLEKIVEAKEQNSEEDNKIHSLENIKKQESEESNKNEELDKNFIQSQEDSKEDAQEFDLHVIEKQNEKQIANQETANQKIVNQQIANQEIANQEIANQEIVNQENSNKENENKLFECDQENINLEINNELNIEGSFEAKSERKISNEDKMFFLELIHKNSIQEDSDYYIDYFNKQNSLQKAFFQSFLQFSCLENKYFSNKEFFKFFCFDVISKIKKEISKIDIQKQQLKKQFGVISVHEEIPFQYSFFSNFYLDQIEKEYITIRETFETNQNLKEMIEAFNLLEGTDLKDNTEGIPELIRNLKKYTTKPISIEKKIQIQNILKQNPTLFEPNLSFKQNNLTGQLCHVLRDIIFHTGVILNILTALPDQYNTINHYKFLMEKENYYERMIKRVEGVIGN